MSLHLSHEGGRCDACARRNAVCRARSQSPAAEPRCVHSGAESVDGAVRGLTRLLSVCVLSSAPVNAVRCCFADLRSSLDRAATKLVVADTLPLSFCSARSPATNRAMHAVERHHCAPHRRRTLPSATHAARACPRRMKLCSSQQRTSINAHAQRSITTRTGCMTIATAATCLSRGGSGRLTSALLARPCCFARSTASFVLIRSQITSHPPFKPVI